MSVSATRQAIATALSTVDGVQGYVRRPTAPKQGDAWPLWRGSERAEGMESQTFAVFVALPGDELNADTFADSHGDALMLALQPILYVDSMVPAIVPTDLGDTFALMLTGRTE